MLQGQRDLTTVGRLLLTELAPLVNAHMGVIYQTENEDNPKLRLLPPMPATAPIRTSFRAFR